VFVEFTGFTYERLIMKSSMKQVDSVWPIRQKWVENVCFVVLCTRWNYWQKFSLVLFSVFVCICRLSSVISMTVFYKQLFCTSHIVLWAQSVSWHLVTMVVCYMLYPVSSRML